MRDRRWPVTADVRAKESYRFPSGQDYLASNAEERKMRDHSHGNTCVTWFEDTNSTRR
jgi:hypothetical protein